MLETKRLFLRRFTEDDLEALYVLRSDAETMQYIKLPETPAETLTWLQLVSSRWEHEKIGFCAVILKETSELIGWCGLWRLRETGELEVGYAIIKTMWRKGLASEAAKAFLSHGFEDLGVERIVAVARADNIASRRVMEKIGMSFEKIGIFYNVECAYYAINRETWKIEVESQKSGVKS